MQLSPLGPRDCRKKLRFMKLKSLVERPLEGKTWTSEEEEGQVSSELRVEASAAVLGFLGRIWRGWFCRFWKKLQYEFSYCSCYWSNWHYWDIEAVLLGVLPAGSQQERASSPSSLLQLPSREPLAEHKCGLQKPAQPHTAECREVGLKVGGRSLVTGV